MSELSDDEFAILMIADQGEPMMPIGRWKAPVESLLRRGFLRRVPSIQDPAGTFNSAITEEGRRACQARDKKDQDDFKEVLSKVADAAKPQLGLRVCCGRRLFEEWQFCPTCGKEAPRE